MTMITKRESAVLLCIGFLLAFSTVYAIKAFTIIMPLTALYFVVQQGGFKALNFRWSIPLFCVVVLLGMGSLGILWAQKTLPAFKVILSTLMTVGFGVVLLSTLDKYQSDLFPRMIKVLKSYLFFTAFFISIQFLINRFLPDHYLMMKPGGSILGIVAFASCSFLWTNNNKAFAVVMAAAVLPLLFFTHCLTALYGVILATVAFVFSLYAPLWTTRFSIGITFLVSYFSPILWTEIFPPSFFMRFPNMKWLVTDNLYHRILSWEYYSLQFFKSPFFGEGPDASKYIPGGADLAEGKIGLIHPHNNSIQLYVELGILGGLFYSLLFASLFFLVLRHVKDRLSLAVCNATLVFAFIEAEITHSVWRNYWWSVSFLALWMTLMLISYREGRRLGTNDRLWPSLTLRGGWEQQL